MPAPLIIPLWAWVVGGAAAVGTATVANKIDDNLIDPISSAPRPPVSGVTATLLVAGGVFFMVAKKQKWI